MKRPTVGQTVWAVEQHCRKPRLIECTVEKVGRKYLHVKIDYNITLFHLEDWTTKGQTRYKLYASGGGYGKELERSGLTQEIRNRINMFPEEKRPTLEQCRAIMEVLDK